MSVQRYKVGYYTDEWGMSSNTPCLLRDDNGYAVKFDDYALLKKQRDELLAATEAIAINSEECLDFDECTAMLVSIDDYHKLMEAATRAKGEQ